MGKLTEGRFERYHRDGFAYPIEALAAEEARRCRRAMEKPHLLFTWVDEIVARRLRPYTPIARGLIPGIVSGRSRAS